jgi:CubicO group peptidase (beta-lactamase class C family)
MDLLKKHFRRTTVLLFLFALTALTRAQTGIDFETFRGADSVISSFMKTWHLGGGSVAIVKDGNLIYNKGFGYSDMERTIPAEPNSLYRIASISKPITSLAIMKLVEEGYLGLQDKVFGPGRLIQDPYYLNAIADPRIYEITVEELLNHTSGWDSSIPYGPFPHCDPPFFPLYVTEAAAEPNPVGDSTLIRFKLGNGLQHDPGSSYSYSNVGFLVLGKIITRVSGLPYEEYIRRTFLEPAGVYDMHLGKNLKEEKQEREVDYLSHAFAPSCYGDGSMVLSQYGGFNLEAMNAHGGWISSAPDLARLLVALKHEELLSAESIHTMLTPGPVNPSYALGWQVNSKGNYWHTGSLDGTSAFAATTADGYTWVFLFNGRSDNSAAFWMSLDKLPRAALKTVKEFPDVNLFSPARNSGTLVAHSMTPGTVLLRWQNGDGDGRMIVASTKPLTSFPLEGAAYTADPEYGLGASLDEDAFVVYAGEGSRATISNLDPAQVYYFTAIEYNRSERTGYREVYKPGGRQQVDIKPDTWVKM